MTESRHKAYRLVEKSKFEISIDPGVKAEIDAHMLDAYPEEAVGFIFGTEEKHQRRITHHLAVLNTQEENREKRYLVSPVDYMRAEQFAVLSSLLLLGIYHSHPDHPCLPSPTDLAYALPYFSYQITSVEKGRIGMSRSWRLDEKTNLFINESFITH